MRSILIVLAGACIAWTPDSLCDGQTTKVRVAANLIVAAQEARAETAESEQRRQAKHEFPDVANLPLQKGLPDPFLMADGKRVRTLQDWRKQREYLKAMLAHYLYGRIPDRPKEIEIKKQVGSKQIYEEREWGTTAESARPMERIS